MSSKFLYIRDILKKPIRYEKNLRTFLGLNGHGCLNGTTIYAFTELLIHLQWLREGLLVHGTNLICNNWSKSTNRCE